MSTLVAVGPKGIDLIAWRGCAKQKELGQRRFAVTLKQLGRKAALAPSLPPPPQNPQSVPPERRRMLVQYDEIRQGAAIFAQGTPECPACPLSDGKAYGCYVALDFPIDATAERALFDFFASQVGQEGTSAGALYRDLISKAPTHGTAWHDDRGPSGMLAELDTPLVKEWGFLMWKKRLDSAQILGSLFFVQTRLGMLSGFAKFWEEFIAWAQANVKNFSRSRSCQQLEQISEYYERVLVASSAFEGIGILVESDAPGHETTSQRPPPTDSANN